uniref:Ig-like domain-containing protein n=1 Tax=Oryzias latipes TaxID=8090 RepID=A0A3B3H4Y9_ORYLA
ILFCANKNECTLHRTLGVSLCALKSAARASTVTGFTGHNITLPCLYDYYGPLSVCWGRGAIPNSGCGNQVIKADGTSVVSRLSERYVLRGNLGQGDVSLTILQAVEADSGIYGCRVDIPGWFNDQKQEVTLTVKPGTQNILYSLWYIKLCSTATKPHVHRLQLPTEEVRSVHPAAIVVPVVLVLIGAMATIWQLRRECSPQRYFLYTDVEIRRTA